MAVPGWIDEEPTAACDPVEGRRSGVTAGVGGSDEAADSVASVDIVQ